MGYDIVLCEVLEINLGKRWVTLKPLNSNFIDEITVESGAGLKFASSYAPFLGEVDTKTGKINNVPVGIVNYPQAGDRVLALIWMTEMTEHDRLHTTLSQNPFVEVIILARVSWDHPQIGPYDHIIADQSGAKLHFNHGWRDLTTDHVKNLPPEYLEKKGKAASPHQLRTGHVTLVGNRLVTLSGQKFLPFGLFSHLLGQAKDENPVVFPESKTDSGTGGGAKEGTKWGEVFTKDPTETNLFDKLPDAGGVGSSKFLEPPCPEPGAMMDMHDSGYKRLIENNGQVREFKESLISVIGDDSSGQTMKKVAFDPEGQDEVTKLPNQSSGESLKHFIDESGAISTLHMKQGGDANSAGLIELEINGISINVKDGDLPTSLPVTFGGETVVKNKILIKFGTTIIELDGATPAINITVGAGNKFKITGDLEVTGNVKGASGTFG